MDIIEQLPDLDAIIAGASGDAPPPDMEPAELAPEPEPVPAAPAAEPPPPQDPRIDLRSLMEQERELQAARAELARQQQASQEQLKKYQRYEQLERALAEKNAEEAIGALGFTLDEVNQAALEGRGVDPTRVLERKMAEQIEAAKAQVQAQVDQLKQLQTQELVTRARMETEQHIRELSPALSAMGPSVVDTVIDRFQQHYSETGAVPTYDQVVRQVESELFSIVDSLMGVEAVKQRYLAATPSGSPVRPSPTLSNQAAATVAKRKPANATDDLPLDSEEAINELLARFK